jgi:hypothetical protein
MQPGFCGQPGEVGGWRRLAGRFKFGQGGLGYFAGLRGVTCRKAAHGAGFAQNVTGMILKLHGATLTDFLPPARRA